MAGQDSWDRGTRSLCAHSHPLAGYERITLSDLLGREVYIADSISHERVVLENRLVRAGVHPVNAPYNETEVLTRCAKGGIFLLESSLYDSFFQLKCIPLSPEQVVIHGLVYASGASSTVQSFIHYLRKTVGEEQIREMEQICREMEA